MGTSKIIEQGDARSVTGQIGGVLDYTIELRPTRDHGAEVVVFLVNEAECDMEVFGVTVRYKSGLLRHAAHQVYFHDADRRGRLALPQFVVREGHFHLDPKLLERRELSATITIDYELAGTRGSAEVVRQVPTAAIRRG